MDGPAIPPHDQADRRRPDRPAPRGRRRHLWNLVLLVPFLMLVTPWFNTIEPQLFGMPWFYWSQLVWVAVGVLAVGIVHVATRDRTGGRR